jgi:phosphatidylglycerol---prolipoprotein diacylglyceryl transferase
MVFPHYFHLFGFRFHPHPVMELIAYSGGFQLYLYLRRRQPRDAVPFEQNMWLIVGCVFGALIGSKLLAWVESAPEYWQHRHELAAWLGGKTIVGGLLGGWAGVEIAKKFMHIRRSAGDLFVYPLILGQSIGRIGCFLTGLDDHTCGIFTSLPWGVNFGDGPRHPTQLYEILFLLILGLGIYLFERSVRNSLSRPAWEAHRDVEMGESHLDSQNPSSSDENDLSERAPGRAPQAGRLNHFLSPQSIVLSPFQPLRGGVRFRFYMIGYLGFRFFIEFIKPRFAPYAGLSAIQLASLIGIIVCVTELLSGRGLDAAEPATEHVPTEAPA